MSQFTFLNNKTVLVTGVSSSDQRFKNIGQALVELLVENDAQVIAVSRDIKKCKKAVKHLTEQGLPVVVKQCDISSHSDVESLFKWVEETYGSLNYLINNAGTEGVLEPVDQLSLDNIDSVIDINGKGTLYCLKEGISLMKRSLSKDNKMDCSIINVGSIAAEIGMPNTSVYAYSKAGIASITRVVTIELNAYALETDTVPIRVNAVLPGVIRTPMHGRFLDDNGLDGIPPAESTSPEELAKCIITRLNEKFLMGSVSIIDGGYTAQ